MANQNGFRINLEFTDLLALLLLREKEPGKPSVCLAVAAQHCRVENCREHVRGCNLMGVH